MTSWALREWDLENGIAGSSLEPRRWPLSLGKLGHDKVAGSENGSQVGPAAPTNSQPPEDLPRTGLEG